MVRITRRGFGLGLGVTALAAVGGGPDRGSAQGERPSGKVVAIPIDPNTLDSLPGLVVVDLDDGGATTELDLPVVTLLYPIDGTARLVARVAGGAFAVDAAAGTADEIRVRLGTAVDDEEPFSDTSLIQVSQEGGSTRHAVFAAASSPRWLIDLEAATVVDLVAEFAQEDPFFQLASFTPDGTGLLLATSQLVALVDAETLQVVSQVTDAPTIAAPQLSPGGGRVGWVWRGPGGRTAVLMTSAVDGPDLTPEFPDESSTLGFAWIDDESVLLWRYPEGGALTLERLDLGSRKPIELGAIAGVSGYPRILAHGTRAVVGSDADDETRWRLVDLDRNTIVPVPDLDGLTSYGMVQRSSRAVVFGPADLSATAAGGEFVVLNTATGQVAPLVEKVEGQYYPYPTISPDGRSAVIGMSGPEGDAIWLCDLVRAETIRLDGYLGAVFSPDSRFVLMRKLGVENPTEIRSLDGEVVRELDAYQRVWWVDGA